MREQRVLDSGTVGSIEEYRSGGGGAGLEAAARMGGAAVLEELVASGLRGRGGAGFPTGRKWQTIVQHRPPGERITVVVNGAEGEPGSFKDRLLLRRNPYRVLEGALIAARTVDADRVVLAVKPSSDADQLGLDRAVAEVEAAGWCDGTSLEVQRGPSDYLYGEETALLEVLAGRAPFPRVTPPWRRGIDEVAEDGSSAEAAMAGPDAASPGEPALVNNVETMANVALVLANGPSWFREVGTADSPGTIVCTVSGDVQTAGVAEFAMGTPMREVLEAVGGGGRSGRIVAALSGVSNPLLPEHLLDTPLTYEDMLAAGSGLGACGFLVLDEGTDVLGVVHGVSRFLAVESCGQCVPCKQDGLAISDLLDRLRRGEADDASQGELVDRLASVTDGARCTLALQHQAVVESLLALYPEEVRAALLGGPADRAPVLIAPLVDIVDGEALLDERQRVKQPDWTYEGTYSGQSPADRIDTQLEG